MIKPTKVFPLPPMIDYDEMIMYLGEKYAPKPVNDGPLWDWINRYDNLESEAFLLNVVDDVNNEIVPEPVRKMLQLILDEFKEDLDKTGYLQLWIS